jgi:hypothetical protein
MGRSWLLCRSCRLSHLNKKPAYETRLIALSGCKLKLELAQSVCTFTTKDLHGAVTQPAAWQVNP